MSGLSCFCELYIHALIWSSSCQDPVAYYSFFFLFFIKEFFAKLTQIASIATDMFVGRERFATILLMRLTETVILWLSDDQSFWGEIEAGPKPLSTFGLQQVYFP